MNKIILILTLSLFASQNISAAAGSATAYTYALAHRPDLDDILKLYEAAEKTDAAKNIVIMPTEIRCEAVDEGIKEGHLFVASQGPLVVGLKKFYAITGKDRYNTLRDEIRCIDADCAPLTPNAYGRFAYNPDTDELTKIDGEPHTPYHEGDVFFYNGGDLTDEAHRGKGINAKLTAHALKEVAAPIITAKSPRAVHIVYGLVYENQGSPAERAASILSGRTSGIAKTIAQFLAQTTERPNVNLTIARFNSEKPTFTFDEAKGLQVHTTGISNGDGFVVSCELPK